MKSRIMFHMKNRDDKKKFKYVWSHNGRIYARTAEESEQKPLPKASIVNNISDHMKFGWTKDEVKNIIKNKRNWTCANIYIGNKVLILIILITTVPYGISNICQDRNFPHSKVYRNGKCYYGISIIRKEKYKCSYLIVYISLMIFSLDYVSLNPTNVCASLLKTYIIKYINTILCCSSLRYFLYKYA